MPVETAQSTDWTDEAIAAFQARSIAINELQNELQKAELALSAARRKVDWAQRAYEREVDAMVARRALTEAEKGERDP